MGFLDAIRGRREPARPNLDALFALPGAAVTLQLEFDLTPTGRGAVAFRSPEGRAFADVVADVRALLDADAGPAVEAVHDDYGFDWLVVNTNPPDLGAVVTDVHAVNTSVVNAGFGPQLLCTVIGFTDPQNRSCALVYLFKQGTFYPFAPLSDQRRDNVFELQIRDVVQRELPIEPVMERWFAVWDAPGL